MALDKRNITMAHEVNVPSYSPSQIQLHQSLGVIPSGQRTLLMTAVSQRVSPWVPAISSICLYLLVISMSCFHNSDRLVLSPSDSEPQIVPSEIRQHKGKVTYSKKDYMRHWQTRRIGIYSSFKKGSNFKLFNNVCECSHLKTIKTHTLDMMSAVMASCRLMLASSILTSPLGMTLSCRTVLISAIQDSRSKAWGYEMHWK